MGEAVLHENSGNDGASSRTFSAIDPGLPLTAARAAVELGLLLKSKQDPRVKALPLSSVKALSLLLSGSIGSPQASSPARRFVDPLGVDLFAEAYNESYKAHTLKTRDQVRDAARELVYKLTQAIEGREVDEASMTTLQDFCVELSEHAAAYRKMVYGNRRQHSYRK